MSGLFGIEEVPAGTPGAITCGACGRSWTEDMTPAGRCPWEYQHDPLPPLPAASSLPPGADLLGMRVIVTGGHGATWQGTAVAISYDPSVLIETTDGQRLMLPLSRARLDPTPAAEAPRNRVTCSRCGRSRHPKHMQRVAPSVWRCSAQTSCRAARRAANARARSDSPTEGT